MKTLTQILKQTAKKILAPALISTALLTGLQGSSCDSKPYIPTTTSSSTSTSTSTSQEPKYHVSGNLTDILTETPIQGATINLDSYPGWTNSNGDYSLQVPEGDYTLTTTASGYYEKESSLPIYADSTNNNFELIPDSVNRDFYLQAFQSYDKSNYIYPNVGVIQRIPDSSCTSWQVYIDTTTAYGTEEIVTQEMIDMAVNNIEGNDSRTGWQHLTRGKVNPTRANGRIKIGKNPPAFGTPGWSIVRWNGTLPSYSGVNIATLSENNIIFSKVSFNPDAPEKIYKHELYQVLGARNDSQSRESIINDPLTIDYINQQDIDDMNIAYKMLNGEKLFY